MAAEKEAGALPVNGEYVTGLLQTLHRVEPRYTEERLAALQKLEELRGEMKQADCAEAASTLVAILSGRLRETRASAVRRLLHLFAVGGAAAALILCAVVGSTTNPDLTLNLILSEYLPASILTLFIACFVAAPVSFPFYQKLDGAENDRVRTGAARALGALQVRSGLAAMARACRDRCKSVRETATASLPLLLPGLLEPGAGPLTAEESAALARALPRTEPDIQIRILEVLEAAGAPAALEPLRSIEFGWARRDTGTERVALIRRTIARLEFLRKEDLSRETLLRPAAGEVDASLLRPAAAGPSDPTLLLRQSAENE